MDTISHFILTHPPVAFVVFLTVADEDLPAGRQVSYSYPGMRLAVSVIHSNEITKDSNTSQLIMVVYLRDLT